MISDSSSHLERLIKRDLFQEDPDQCFIEFEYDGSGVVTLQPSGNGGNTSKKCIHVAILLASQYLVTCKFIWVCAKDTVEYTVYPGGRVSEVVLSSNAGDNPGEIVRAKVLRLVNELDEQIGMFMHLYNDVTTGRTAVVAKKIDELTKMRNKLMECLK